MKDYQINNIDEDEAVKEIMKKRLEIIEQFTKAYIAETGIFPSQLELVCEKTTEDNVITETYYFKRRADGPQG